jgi:hypothetical protein
MPVQPAGMSSDFGVILTIGFDTASDRSAIVMPFCTPSTIVSPTTMCQDLVSSFQDASMADLLDCVSSSASLVYIQAEGMVDGRIPYRTGFQFGVNPGTRGGDTLPSQVTALLTYYCEPADLTSGARMKVAKNFIPFIAADDVSFDTVSSDLVGNMLTFGQLCLTGFPSSVDPSKNWFRVLAAVKPRVVVDVTRCASVEPRSYVATQRRRLKPRLV